MPIVTITRASDSSFARLSCAVARYKWWQKIRLIKRCVFSWRTFPLNFIPIRFDTTEHKAFHKAFYWHHIGRLINKHTIDLCGLLGVVRSAVKEIVYINYITVYNYCYHPCACCSLTTRLHNALYAYSLARRAKHGARICVNSSSAGNSCRCNQSWEPWWSPAAHVARWIDVRRQRPRPITPLIRSMPLL